MRVLGKYDLDNAILFSDLLTLLENYGVSEARTSANINNSATEINNYSIINGEAQGLTTSTRLLVDSAQ